MLHVGGGIRVLNADTEGAEVEALKTLTEARSRLLQNLIVYDQTARPSAYAGGLFAQRHEALLSVGNQLLYFGGCTCDPHACDDQLRDS